MARTTICALLILPLSFLCEPLMISGGWFCNLLLLGFLFLAPGTIVVNFLRLEEPLLEGILALTMSIVLMMLVTSVALYTGHWSIMGIVNVLACFCCVGAAIQLLSVCLRVLERLPVS
ncbi:hypothetical protein EI42_05163 [Thermosporothrix hazakensis]|jgi:hypothetical protein|uniref:Uncharacterized protein n=2 Tax=Thermosporothrix TaxID=768650 RepID=A0A326U0S9_THEHA|nr:hypothetical protein [Thermosporothrix hazakensis]PZW22951.1 hypothetical protein EI42_05163 [Thermosporothrix hazakensis]BBH90043.1 hypothetical protein KTC_47940 [Thermosporothrix sp. COM3]GCE48264.1 hypothetical protein KTH_31330 [Thermosporothrix hazakensis]